MNYRRFLPILTVMVLAVGMFLAAAPPVRADTVVIDEDTKDELLRMLDDIFDEVIDLKVSVENDISSHILQAKEALLIAKAVIDLAEEEIGDDPAWWIQRKKKKAEKYIDSAKDYKDNGKDGIEDVMDVKRNLEDLVESYIKVVEEALEDGEIDATLAAEIIDKANEMIMDLEYKNNLLLLIQFRIFKADESIQYAKSWLELANEVLCTPYLSAGTVQIAGDIAPYYIEDSEATFITDGVMPGDIIHNLTRGGKTEVTAVPSETKLYLKADIFEVGDAYRIERRAPGIPPEHCLGINLPKAEEHLRKAEKELEEALRHLKRVQKFEEKFLENIKRNLHRNITNMRKLVVEARPRVMPAPGVTVGVRVLPFSAALAIKTAQDINAARFEALGLGVSEIRVEVFGLNGAKLFDSGFAPGNKLAWRLNTDAGDVIANGVYLYVVTVKNYNGEAIRSEARKLVVLR